MPTATKATRARVPLTPLPSLEDADLVRRARDGDDRAFEEIVRRYRAPLIRYSARHVGRDNAEDITQHALARAAMHLRDDPRPIHLRAWLYRVAHNAAINMRSRKDFGHEELSPEIDGVPQPPELAAQRSEVREVVSELDRLPDRQRTALLLSVFEGLGYDEIASRLDTSPNSVRALLSRARMHLRRAAVALAPWPLIQSLMRNSSGVPGISGGSESTLAAGSTLIQAKLMAVAATTLVAGAATAERATSQNEPEGGGQTAAAAVADVPVTPAAAIPLDTARLLPEVAAPPPDKPKPDPASAQDSAPPSGPEPVTEPPPPPAEPVAEEPPPPSEPAAEEPPAEPAPVEEPPAESPPPEDTDKEGFEGDDAGPPPPDGNNPPDGQAYTPTEPEGYTPVEPDGYTPAE